MKHTIKRTILAGAMALVLGVVTTHPVVAAPLQLSDVPLFIDLQIEPNVVVSLDDSGSMRRCYILNKGISKSRVEEKKGMTAYEINALAYNPSIEYVVPVDGDGVNLGVPPFTFAWEDGFDPARVGNEKELDLVFSPCWDDLYDYKSTPLGDQHAYYHTFSGDPDNNSNSGTGVGNQSNYTKIVVGSGADIGFGSTPTEKKQNFANWFSYYRNRFITMKSAGGRAFVSSNLGGPNTGDAKIRVAYQGLWGLGGKKGDGDRRDISIMKKFEGTGRNDFFDWLYGAPKAGSTPLRYTMRKAGEYYSNKKISNTSDSHGYTAMAGKDSPWAFEPGVTKDPEFTCRQAFHVLLTDGSWNNDPGISGEVDSSNQTYPEALPSGATLYDQFAPYDNSNSNNLADTAYHFWVTDLRTDLANDIPAYMPEPSAPAAGREIEDHPKNDPATWQHMVNFTVGFGVDGNRIFPDDYDDLLDGSLSWGSNKIDDLWHAAINSRGQYLSAKNPDDLINAFTSALNDVLARTGSGSAVALNSGSLEAGSRVYQARFTSGTWTGQVLAFDINAANGQVIQPEAWDASVKLATRIAGSGWNTNRDIITHNGTQGVPFRWASLSAGQQGELNKDYTGTPDGEGTARLDYLRGDDADEAPAGNKYRGRAGALGDVINSAPAYVRAPPFNYPDTLESGEAYSTFKSTHSTRAPMIYTGANDGMLHAFNGDTGEEVLAYVPGAVYPNLSQLTATNYGHRFYVDGAPTVGDAFWGTTWHTVVAGGLRKGGQAIYALDVTNPSTLAEGNASNIALWEFTDADDQDLGYTYSRPAIVRMANNKWAAVFGNGYNNTEADGNPSTSGNAVLYIAFIQDGMDGTWTGSDFIKIDTGAGSVATPNGLATVSPVDVDGDRTIDYIYGGDLLGNMWKFDVSSSSTGSWGVAYSGNPLFVATDDGGVTQPITTRPEVGLHPEAGKDGYMVYFGTGKYIESGDNITTSTQTQTFYGIWDPDSGATPPSYDRIPSVTNLLEQTIDDEITAFGAEVRLVSDNAITWASDAHSPGGGEHIGWFMDLINLGGSPVANNGERQVTTSVLNGGRIIFSTLIPSGSSCVFGGDGWIMELDASDGSRLDEPPFDLDNNGTFDLVDDGGTFVAPGGTKSTGGAPSSPAILDAGDGQEYKYISGTDGGSIQVISEQGQGNCTSCTGTRESWQQLR